MIFKVTTLFFARPAVVPHRRQNLQARVQCPERDLEAHLIVAGRRATMCDRRSSPYGGKLGQPRSLKTTLCADAQGIKLTPTHVAGNEIPQNRVEKVPFAIEQHMFDRTEPDCAILEGRCSSVVNTAGIDCGRNNVASVILFQSRDTE